MVPRDGHYATSTETKNADTSSTRQYTGAVVVLRNTNLLVARVLRKSVARQPGTRITLRNDLVGVSANPLTAQTARGARSHDAVQIVERYVAVGRGIIFQAVDNLVAVVILGLVNVGAAHSVGTLASLPAAFGELTFSAFHAIVVFLPFCVVEKLHGVFDSVLTLVVVKNLGVGGAVVDHESVPVVGQRDSVNVVVAHVDVVDDITVVVYG